MAMNFDLEGAELPVVLAEARLVADETRRGEILEGPRS